jgi:hypothetical protein
MDLAARLRGQAVAFQIRSGGALGYQSGGFATEAADEIDRTVGLARAEALVLVTDAWLSAAEASRFTADDDGGAGLRSHGVAQAGQDRVDVKARIVDPMEVVEDRGVGGLRGLLPAEALEQVKADGRLARAERYGGPVHQRRDGRVAAEDEVHSGIEQGVHKRGDVVIDALSVGGVCNFIGDARGEQYRDSRKVG